MDSVKQLAFHLSSFLSPLKFQ